jgi:hypothetical protein
MMNHMLMADVLHFYTGALQRISVGLSFIAQRIETCSALIAYLVRKSDAAKP